MGLLINGTWHDQWYNTAKYDGEFVREDSHYHHWVTPDGSPGPTGDGGFIAEPGRYHLYVSLACPWAHRTLIFRKLKRLEEIISISIVKPHMLENGWEFSTHNGKTSDSVNQAQYLYQIYTMVNKQYTGRVTVPVLWDKHRQTIVNNESAEIIRMLNSAFSEFTDEHFDYYPPHLQGEINKINSTIYEDINNGVYRCGFATRQKAYESAFHRLFSTLDKIEARLLQQRYLAGDKITEADWRLFTTLIRFDAVYYLHFKCNLCRIVDFPNLSNYLRELYQWPGIAATVNFEHIKQHYYYSHKIINPNQIVPLGPSQDLWAAHNRGRLDHVS